MKASCLNCNTEFEFSSTNRKGKYCNNKCQAEYFYKTVTLPKILLGEAPSRNVKMYLVKQNNSCSECGQGDMYNGKPLTLQLDHIDGNSDNNQLTNVRLLCPNCHTQT